MKKNVASYIKTALALNGKTSKWLSQKLDVRESTISSKFKSNSFTAEELIEIAILLNINLESIKEDRMKNVIEFGDVKFEISDINNLANENLSTGKIPAMFYMFEDNDDPQKPEEAKYRIYVLNGELKGDDWILTTISNYGGGNLGGKEFGFMRFHLHKLYQLRSLFDLEVTVFENKNLTDLVREVWGEEIDKSNERKVFENKFLEYVKNPWVI